ncbi:FAD:protein FMN transferase [Herbiconiux sp. 11R-BC]|uniref:FAD:protein FMN transferase n=1 Tax=Herbiconiux sp. 11R-BC TaxID=3111637 RepID=UPI003C011C80
MPTHVFDTMGTTVSIRSAGPAPSGEVLREVEEAFAGFDRRFSLYRDDSELSRVARGELALHHAGSILRDTYAAAMTWSHSTAGAFTPHRPDGVLDLSGLVKADAIAAAGRILDAGGAPSWMLNAGGDILVRGAVDGMPWRLGIVDPDARGTLLCTVALDGARRALATSGTAERGEHVWRRPAAAADSRSYRQVSVIADDIVTADVLATALLAGGPERCDDLLDRFDVDVLLVDDRGDVTASPGFRSAAGLILA